MTKKEEPVPTSLPAKATVPPPLKYNSEQAFVIYAQAVANRPGANEAQLFGMKTGAILAARVWQVPLDSNE